MLCKHTDCSNTKNAIIKTDYYYFSTIVFDLNWAVLFIVLVSAVFFVRYILVQTVKTIPCKIVLSLYVER